MNTTMIGLDLAKSVFQVHGTDARVRCFGGGCGAPSWNASLRCSRPQSWAWKLAPGRITRAHTAGMGTKCG